MRRRHAGFTLIEAVIAMSAVSLLAGIAVPALQDAAEAGRSGAAKGHLHEAWLSAVSHAANAGSEVVLCPGDATGCRASLDWSGGWITYADINGNRTRDAHEPLLSQAGPLGGKVHLRSTSGRTGWCPAQWLKRRQQHYRTLCDAAGGCGQHDRGRQYRPAARRNTYGCSAQACMQAM